MSVVRTARASLRNTLTRVVAPVRPCVRGWNEARRCGRSPSAGIHRVWACDNTHISTAIDMHIIDANRQLGIPLQEELKPLITSIDSFDESSQILVRFYD